MLSKSDKEFLREAVREELRKALTVKVLMEQRRDMKTGQPLPVPVTSEKEVYIPKFWVEFLPYFEGSIRGIQETTDHVKNQVSKSKEVVETMARIMLDVEGSLTRLHKIAAALPDKGNVLEIEAFVGDYHRRS